LHDAAPLRFKHKLAAVEDFLICKAHSLLGIGSESSGSFYAALRSRLPLSPPHDGAAALASAFVAPLIAHDTQVWQRQRRRWEQRDNLLATQLFLHHMAVSLNSVRPEFTLAYNDGDANVRSNFFWLMLASTPFF
jgi:hypothetical protein